MGQHRSCVHPKSDIGLRNGHSHLRSIAMALNRKRSFDSSVPGDDGDIDIASALTATHPADGDGDGDGDGDDGLDEFIHDAIVRRNVKGGTDLLRKIKSRGNGKGDVGGGSFQSMGRCYTPPSSILSHTSRPPSVSASCAYPAGIPYADTDPACSHPLASCSSPTRSRGHGAHGLRKDPRIHDPPGTTPRWPPCPCLWCTRNHPRTGQGTRPPGRQSR